MKSLYKLTREKLFIKSYLCIYCGMKDFEKDWMRQHVKHHHDERAVVARIFICKKCFEDVRESSLVEHQVQTHKVTQNKNY